MRWLKFVVPLLVFAVIGWFLLRGLDRDPRELPSPLIGKAAPSFVLPVLANPTQTWSPQEMRGRVWLLNVWGSWCSACQIEHPVLLDLARTREVPIVGMAWKDMLENSNAWLTRLGNPYDLTVSDFAGKVAIDYGVYGAPETFLIDKQGTIRYKHVGPVSPEFVKNTLMPMVRQLQAAS